MTELSLLELDGELAAELPARNLMRRKKKHAAYGWFPKASASASASYGSASNANATYQINFNPQIVINNGTISNAGIGLLSGNANGNANTQTGVPINFSVL